MCQVIETTCYAFAVMAMLALSSSCSSSPSEEDNLAQAVADSEQAMAKHAEAITGSTTLEAVTAEEDAHYLEMLEMMSNMEGMMTSEELSEECSNMSLEDMTAIMSTMGEELEEHHAAMLAASSMEGALMEEEQHQGDMTDMLEMMSGRNEMDDSGGMMRINPTCG